MASSISLRVNQSISVTTNIDDGYGAFTSAKTINYVSSDPTVATLANAGSFLPGTNPQNSSSLNTIYGISNGTATITVSIDGTTVINTIVVIVNSPPPTAITFVFGTPTP